MENKNVKRRNSKRSGRPIYVEIGLVALFVVLVVVVIVFARKPENSISETEPGMSTTGTTISSDSSMKEMILHSVVEDGDLMLVSTSYGDFSYPFAYSDLIEIDTVSNEDCVALLFMANLQGSAEPIYTLWINAETGIYAGELNVDGKNYPLYVEILEPRQDLDAALLASYNAVRDTLTEVLQSMENSGMLEVEG